ncbi:MAG TPA: STAS domain-containing protein [Candidatus Limnocylindrales bacterium]|nr:STAS domain-containing protein [Candidatus Limnocylindrales bacterium]
MSLFAIHGPTGVTGMVNRVWVVEPGIDHAGIAAACERFVSFMGDVPGDSVIICDVGAITRPDLATLALLARMQLTARRLGSGIRLHRAQDRLVELILFSGLGGVLPLSSELVRELGREAEQGEEPVHVEEVVDPLDPSG